MLSIETNLTIGPSKVMLTSMCLHRIFLSHYEHHRACTNFLEMYCNRACINEFNISQYKFSPH